MQNFIQITQIVLSILLVVVILLQHRGTGLGGAFGGEANVYRSRRGIEDFLYKATIVIAVLFVGFSIFSLIYL
jgi:preprotein translocase subunit SecG